MGKKVCLLITAVLLLIPFLAGARPIEPLRYDSPIVRLKDVARIQGVRENQIYGLGLVVGLQGTGDGAGARANIQMIANMLDSFGISVSASDLRMRNIAAVMVTADLPTSARIGDRLDVTVSSIGDARSLQGGFLLQTPLQAANGQVFAVAQGAVSIGGFAVRGGGSSAQVNHTTVGKVPNGGIIERELEHTGYGEDGRVAMILAEPDFTTASRLVDVINGAYGADLAWARDEGTILIDVPVSYENNVIGFLAELEELPIRPDVRARVVINERTGTVVMGASVRIATVAVSHGGLSVRVEAGQTVSQPPPFAGGSTVVTDQIVLDVEEQPSHFAVFAGTNNVQDLVDALNAIGATPRDIIAILQAVKAAGALFGELVII
ncbi:MAG TPA: flagellar basal body P-ring protein FlgI [Firmicutes bacterium]|nr:flagellar basal body P-ring protein FlgI [Bacillota bacterium]